MPSCTSRRPSASQLGLAEAEVVERAQHGRRRPGPPATTAMRGCAGSKTTRFRPATRAYSRARSRRAGHQVVLGVEVRRAAAARAARSRARGGSSGISVRGEPDVDGGRGVGDVGDDLQARSTARRARESATACRPRLEQLGDRGRAPAPAPAGCGTSARRSWARSRTCAEGRRRSAPPRRPAGRCRSGCRGGWRRRRGRGRGSCRTRSRSRRRGGGRRARRAAACRRPRSRPAPRSGRAGRRRRPARCARPRARSSLSRPPSGEPW